MTGEPLTPEREQEIREWVGPRIEKEADVKAVQIFNGRALLFETNRAMHDLFDEIDRLRGEMQGMRGAQFALQSEKDHCVEEIDRLRGATAHWLEQADLRAAENEKLRVSLQTLSDDRYCTKHCPSTFQTGRRFHFAECAVGVARAALKAKK